MQDPSQSQSDLLKEIDSLKQKVHELQDFESSYKMMFDGAAEGILVADLRTRQIRYANTALCAMFGYANEEMLQLDIGQIHPRQFLPDVLARFDDLSGEKKQWALNIPCLRKDGAIFSVNISKTVIVFKGALCNAGFFTDMTEHQKAQEDLRASEKRYREIFATSRDGIFITSPEGRWIDCNDAALDIFGYESRQILFQIPVTQLYLNPDDRAALTALIEKQGYVKEHSVQLRRCDGSVVDVLITGGLRRDAQGKVIDYYGTLRDITRQKQAEEELRKNEEILRLITDNMSDMIRVTDLDGTNLYQSPSHFKRLGYRPEDRMNKSVFDIIHPDDLDRCLRVFKEGVIQEHSVTLEYRVRHADGHYVWLESIGDSLRDAHGKMTAIVICSREITERKKMEDELVKSEQKYRGIIKDMQEAYYEGDLAGNFVFINDALCRCIGYSAEEMIGANHRKFQDEVTAKKFYRDFNQVFKTGRPRQGIETEFNRKDGSKASFEISASLRKDAYGHPIGFAGIALDVTARKRTEEALRLSEENFRRSLDDSPLGARIVSATGDTIYANRTLLDLYGYKNIEELRNTPTKDRYAPESYTEFLERRQKRRKGKFVPSEYEVSIIRKDGDVRRLRAFRKEILWNGASQFQILYNDVTERKRAEEERDALQERLYRAEKMEALGRMAGGVAHDLNNVLGGLTGYSELLLMEIPKGHPARANAEKIMLSTKKGTAIVQDLLTLARRGVMSPGVMNLNAVIAAFVKTPVFDEIKSRHPRVTFSLACQVELMNIKGSPLHLEKALMNLILNAAESIKEEGEVTLRTESRYIDTPVKGYEEISEGDYVILSVSDTGMGIPAEHRGKIFEPFYSKKAMGRSGTGLGLSIIWGTVKDHNGYIDVHTEVGKGTTFTLYFPVTREELSMPQKIIPLEKYMGNGESVLVVDDIEEQRDIACGLLQKLGYRVQAVASGEAALEYLKNNKADILVLDMIMEPGMDGLETYSKALALSPGQKAIIVSGFSETDRVMEAQRLGAGAYVRKPYMLETIGMALRDELQKR